MNIMGFSDSSQVDSLRNYVTLISQGTETQHRLNCVMRVVCAQPL